MGGSKAGLKEKYLERSQFDHAIEEYISCKEGEVGGENA